MTTKDVNESLIGKRVECIFTGLKVTGTITGIVENKYTAGFEDKFHTIDGEEIRRKGVLFTTVKEPQQLKREKITPEEIEEINKKIYFRYHKLRLKLIGQKLITPFGIN